MRPALQAFEQAIIDGAARAFGRRAAQLRSVAAKQTTVAKDSWGGDVPIRSPETVVMLGTAALFDDCADDIARMVRP